MIIWINLIKNLTCMVIDIIIIVLMVVYRYSIFARGTNEYRNELVMLYPVIYIIISVYITVLTVLIWVNNPCNITTHPMKYECVACFEETNLEGIKCNICQNTSLCLDCYLKWQKKGDTCPICRAKYSVV